MRAKRRTDNPFQKQIQKEVGKARRRVLERMLENKTVQSCPKVVQAIRDELDNIPQDGRRNIDLT